MFRIVTDTSANLPTDYLLSEQITIIPYTFQSGKGEQSCMDLATFDAKDFYTQMRSGVKVTTSQIPPQRYIDVLTPMLEAGEDVLFVSMFWSIPTAHRWARVCLSCARSTAAVKGCVSTKPIRRFARCVTAWRRSLPLTICAICAGRAVCPIWRLLSEQSCRLSRF